MEENKKDVLPLEGEPLTTPQISEPVVNALAAALSKIETYVPTQYIDDGPPDIDADHLNHAEQAIMRVTNLANGAADAIAALQSQVTQLNNNLNGSTQTTDILSDALKVGIGIHEYNLAGTLYTGILPSPNYAYGNGTVFKRNSTSIMVVLYGALQEPIATNYSSDGQKWLGWNQHALKFDLFTNVVRVTDVHDIGKNCLFRAEYGAANTPTRDVGYIGLSVYIDRTWQFVICSPYAGGKLFFDSVNTTGSWIGWKEIVFK